MRSFRARPQAAEKAGGWTGRLRAARWLLYGCAVAAVAAGAAALLGLGGLEADRLVVEAWRATALGVFGGLFAILARRPNAMLALWALVVGHKAVMAVLGLVFAVRWDAEGAVATALTDGVLAAVLCVALLLAAPWRAPKRS